MLLLINISCDDCVKLSRYGLLLPAIEGMHVFTQAGNKYIAHKDENSQMLSLAAFPFLIVGELCVNTHAST